MKVSRTPYYAFPMIVGWPPLPSSRWGDGEKEGWGRRVVTHGEILNREKKQFILVAVPIVNRCIFCSFVCVHMCMDVPV